MLLLVLISVCLTMYAHSTSGHAHTRRSDAAINPDWLDGAALTRRCTEDAAEGLTLVSSAGSLLDLTVELLKAFDEALILSDCGS